MEKYTVIGANWKRETEIDETLFDRYSERCMEAATKVLESCSEFEPHEDLTNILICHKSNTNDFFTIKTSDALINAGFQEAAEIFQ
jgi:hypothetical protein